MAEYTYEKLAADSSDVRLVTILPDAWDASLVVQIDHASLPHLQTKSTTILGRDELRATVPTGWNVRQTLESRYLFTYGNHLNPPYITTWKHPGPDFDRSLYEGFSGELESSSDVSYEALSYVWGSTVSDEKLFVRDHQSDRPCTLSIQHNLSRAVRHLRRTDVARTLWVDAICINQHDIAERNMQVKRMGQIYRAASRVVIWVGEEDDDSTTALEAVAHLGRQLEFSIDHFLIRHPEAEHSDWFLPETPLPYTPQAWQALEKFFHREWFDRLWVVQEAALSNRFSIIQCGIKTALWSEFRRGVTLLDDEALPSQLLQKRLDKAALLTAETTWSARRLLVISREKRCFDSRDKLYGILSIAPPSLAAEIVPDYHKDAATVYVEAFLVYLYRTRRLTFIRFASPSSTVSLPSWAPDWSSTSHGHAILWNYFASSSSAAEYVYRAPDVLTVTGVHVATVSTVTSPVADDEHQFDNMLREARGLRSQSATYITGESVSRALVLTIVFGRCIETYPKHTYPTIEEWEKILEGNSQLSSKDVWLSRLRRWWSGKSFFATHEGYVAAANTVLAQPDDVVTVILGCSSPMILRPGTTPDSYTVVDECHMHGLMFGEALLGPLPTSCHIELDIAPSGSYTQSFIKTASGSRQVLEGDPRLGSLPDQWEDLHAENQTADEPPPCFRHRPSGEAINSDPRLTASALIQKDVRLRSFSIV